MTTLFESDLPDYPELRNLTGMEFRLVINTCQDIWGENNATCEKDTHELNEALRQIHVDITILSEYLDREESGRYYKRSAVSPVERYFLGESTSNLVEK